MWPARPWFLANALCGVVILLAGCASLAPSAKLVDASFERSGRVSIKTDDAQGMPQQFAAGFTVQSSGQNGLRLLLTDPLGNIQAEVISGAAGSSLRVPNKPAQQYGSFSELTQTLTGVAIPPSAWRYWLLGRLDPTLPGKAIDADNLTQAGFAIRIAARHGDGAPRVISIARADRADLVVRLAVDAAQP
jgi:outer membrane biogenesis lipoprotein LolB